MTETIDEADRKVKLARDGIPVARSCTYFDTGSVGPISAIFADALQQRTQTDLRTGRALAERWEAIERSRNQVRAEVASLLGVVPSTLELTQSTTAGIRALMERFPWQPGDEIVSTELEFPRCLEVVNHVATARGVVVRVAETPEDAASEIDWLERCLSKRTRLIVVSGVAYATGARLPIREIARVAAAHGIRTMIDGAQLVGAAELDLSGIPIDFLALPLQKWLCGPEGLGALYVRRESADLLEADRVVHGWPVIEATAEHLVWLRESLGWHWIRQRSLELATYARQVLDDIPGIRLVTPTSHAALVAVRYQPDQAERLVASLERRKIIARHRPELALFRISTAFFNTREEIDRFAAALQ